MGYYNTNELRSGLKIILDGEPCLIIDHKFVKPGKGQAFSRVRLRTLVSDKVLDKVFKSGDSVEAANIIDINLVYLYKDGEFWYFINQKNFEQLAADAKAVSDNAKWLVEQSKCVLTLWNDKPIIVTPPNFVELEITATDPGLKGDTFGTGVKLATLITGTVVKVPLFVQIGEVIRVNTRSGQYVSRVT
ncbi:Elongation factor P [Candidatus Moranella endobia PCVAL]|uniref:Elongation factor P n=1 Tax=Moranella endobia (strain PCIT) TaxID=903503 RepID=F7XXQ4_MOREP|nr:elongation factor P [Candidatus Moranella endobia]AEI74880.1 translational elongation factor P [Candidatus Moranella endobia PCIT]AGJ61126.1 Elongation factor P [Candidatus Moranella endobia PCVAL]